jgi:hypothetical protein
MAFLLAGSIIAAALLSWTQTAILTDVHARQAADLRFAANAAAQVTIEQQRYTYQVISTLPLDATTSAWDCTPTNFNSSPSIRVPVVVFCQIQFQPGTTSSRVLTLSVCQATNSPTALADCVGTQDSKQLAYLSAQISFNDYSASGVQACTSLSNRWSCGTGMTINRWQSR